MIVCERHIFEHYELTKRTSSQWAWYLNWQSTAQVSQRSWIRFPFSLDFFRLSFVTAQVALIPAMNLKSKHTTVCLHQSKGVCRLKGVHNFGERQTSDQDTTRGTRDTRGVPTIADYKAESVCSLEFSMLHACRTTHEFRPLSSFTEIRLLAIYRVWGNAVSSCV